MKKSFCVTIPEPCTESWDQMLPKGCGRFCSTCAKMVTDFTQFSDEAFIAYFLQTGKATCGRFTPQQLLLPIQPPATKYRQLSKLGKYLTALGILTGTTSVNLPAQQRKAEQVSVPPVSGKQQALTGDTTEVLLTGIIIDDLGERVPGAIVTVATSAIKTITDVDGNFEMKIPAVFFKENSTSIRVSASGYEQLQADVSDTGGAALRLILRQSHPLMGDIVVYKKPTLWQKLTRPFRKRYR